MEGFTSTTRGKERTLTRGRRGGEIFEKKRQEGGGGGGGGAWTGLSR
jgi:hypothetical protein